MKREVFIFLIVGIIIALAISVSDYTGAASYGGGYPSGRELSYLSCRSKEQFTTIKAIGSDGSTNPATVKRGSTVQFIISPGKEGAHTGLEVKSKAGRRIGGDHCSRGGSLDFCSSSYQCLSDKACCTSGPKCYGEKIVNFRMPSNREPGTYYATVCDASKSCNKCNEVFEEFLVI